MLALFQTVLVGLFVGSVAIGLLLVFFYLIGASVYDLKTIKAEKQRRLHPQGPWNRYKPLITVLVPAYNEKTGIIRTLESIYNSTYKNVQAIVIDDASKDNTVQLVKDFIKSHPEMNLKVIKRLHNSGKGANLNFAIKWYAKGELVMSLDADCVLEKDAIRNTVRHFHDKKVYGMAANVRVMEVGTILGLLQRVEYLSGYRSKKFNTISNSEYIIGGVGSTYRLKFLKKIGGFDESMQTEDIALSLAIAKLGNKEHRLIYGSDVLISTEPVMTFKSLFRQRYRWKFGALQAVIKHRDMIFSTDSRYTKMLVWLRLPLSLWSEVLLILEPLIFSFLTYSAISRRNPSLYIGASLTMMIYLLFVIWGDEHTSTSTKIRMSFATPVMYFVFYIMTLVQVLSIFRCLRNFKGITGSVKVHGSWISPERIGSQNV